MEDPWGSPWTATDEGTSPTAKPAPPLGLEPPPRAFLNSAAPSLGVPALSYHSPWGHNDEDDFSAAWASPSGGPDPAATAGSLSAWSSGWHGGDAITTPASAAASKQRSRENSLAARSRDGSIGKVASSVIPSPSKALSRSSSNAGLRRASSSLDPWASEPSFGGNLDMPSSPQRAPQTPSLLSPAPVPGSTTNLDLGSPGWDQVDVEIVKSDQDTAEATAEAKETRPSAATPQGLQTEESHEIPRRSRASSTCSNDDDDDDNNSRLGDARRRQDSPITSIDEDSRARQPLPKSHRSAHSVVQRKVSSNKVKDMVVLFDGIAQRAASEPPELERGARVSSVGPAADSSRPSTPSGRPPRIEAGGTASSHKALPDTQEKEDGPSGEDAPEEAGARQGRRKHSVSGTPTPKMRLRTSVSRGRSGSTVTSTPRRPPPGRADFGELKTKFGPAQFVPDLAKVDLIFAKAKLWPVADVTGCYVPDTILRDCFTDVSERRVWARISRFGSARLHDAGGGGFDGGDDGSYRRVAWPASEVRAETIGTVRRWMEEDSFAGGRPTLGGGLGGGNKGKGNMFGWDSAAASDEPAMRLDQVFAQRRLKREAATAKRQSAPPGSSIMGLPPVVTSPGGAPAPAFGTQPVTASVATPSFGWSSSPIAAPPPAPKSAVGPARPMSMFASSPFSIGPSASLSESAGSGAKQAQSRVSDQGEDDDDWGEMMASPPPTGNPTDPSFGMFQDWPDAAHASEAQKNAPDPSPPPAVSKGDVVPESSVPAFTQPPPSCAPVSTASPPLGGDVAPSASVAADPWDLSFFGPPDTETQSQGPPGTQPPSAAISLMADLGEHKAPVAAVPPGAPTPAASIEQQKQHVVSFATPASEIPKTAPSEQAEEYDDLVRQIVQGLPDLSYMLR
ncbi:hypothetical protein RB595_008732 [Gaeumannomyces hyphopodioides]